MEGCYLRFKHVFRIDAHGVNFIVLSAAFALELSKRKVQLRDVNSALLFEREEEYKL